MGRLWTAVTHAALLSCVLQGLLSAANTGPDTNTSHFR